MFQPTKRNGKKTHNIQHSKMIKPTKTIQNVRVTSSTTNKTCDKRVCNPSKLSDNVIARQCSLVCNSGCKGTRTNLNLITPSLWVAGFQCRKKALPDPVLCDKCHWMKCCLGLVRNGSRQHGFGELSPLSKCNLASRQAACPSHPLLFAVY